MAPILVATEGLSEEERRYQLTAAAMGAGVDGHRGASALAGAIRNSGARSRAPPGSGRFLAVIGMQQLVAAIATALATAIIAVVFG
jgi:hypothetical protein